ncbi:PREDICTED: zinc finger CCCH domain-containing protein 11A-like isoform X2 [Wasmannia auropunctata]|nr:PREDICTED: zinc finger CCCH domain-containing protein 11A-like isoform X2 [Wasmannia auropunctata]XP_011698306.1 PREDICTED: zinc finger CCCH domain-containing protein 11A-like isoform X2 [Wasmannia auropunctata]
MEHNHKNLDCYFFYYSTCKKGDFCPYRHEPSALGCETMCTYWQQGNCLNEHCNFRHMELKKNRKSIPCYWETQPGGCRKPHCPFMHTSPRTISSDPINPVKTTEVATKSPNQEWLNRQDDPKYDGSSTTESDQGRGNSEAGSFIGSPAVDPLIVKFEEESDNESAPSPVKSQPKVPYCKTYEQMRLEEIQAESAAYYSYEADNDDGLYQRQIGQPKTAGANRWVSPSRIKKDEPTKELSFKVLSLEEIRQRKRERELAVKTPTDTTSVPELTPSPVGTKSVKRRSMEQHCDKESVSPPKKCKVSSESSELVAKVRPVKLRRSLKRETETQPCGDAATSERGTTGGQDDQTTSCRERLESHGDESVNANRRVDVEIRLCDSSTNEERTQTQPEQAIEDRKSVATYTTEDIMSTAILDIQPYTQTDEEYLRLDTSSDDIMKDIEDLLK